MDEDNPPSYADTMAAIAAGMVKQGIRTPENLTQEEMSGDFSDVVVIFPSSFHSFRSDGSSFQVLDSSLPEEPPPPYSEDTSHYKDNSSLTHQDGPIDLNKNPATRNSNQENLPSIHSFQAEPTAPSEDRPQPSSFQYSYDLRARDRISTNSVGSASLPHNLKPKPDGRDKSNDLNSSETSSDEEISIPKDPSLPGLVRFEQRKYILSGSSPSCTDIKWSVPDNVGSFSGIVYAVQIYSSVKPILSRSPICKPSSDLSEWLEIMDTARPSVRVFLTKTTLTIGPAKWKLDDLRVGQLKVRLRVRAVDDNNRLPSCKKAPWSKRITIVYLKTPLIREAQEEAFSKKKPPSRALVKEKHILSKEEEAGFSSSETARTGSTCKKGARPHGTSKAFRTNDINIEVKTNSDDTCPSAIVSKDTEIQIGSETSTMATLTWTKPSNSTKFVKIWYEVQQYKEPRSPLISKAAGKSLDLMCEAGKGFYEGTWETITEVQTRSLRFQKLGNKLCIGQYHFSLSDTEGSCCIELRIRPVGMKRSDIRYGPWSDNITCVVVP